MRKEKTSGFTLIEISIVIIVIGLVIGGIVAGQELIRAAEIRATIGQLEKFNLATNAFKTKYNCLPGDCNKATIFGFDSATNGNGDGAVGCPDPNDMSACVDGAGYINTQSTREYVNFWYHLSAANMINETLPPFNAGAATQPTGNGVTPSAKIKPPRMEVVSGFKLEGWAVRAKTLMHLNFHSGHNFVLGGYAVTTKSSAGTYWPRDAYAIDIKVDDGLPEQGSARAYSALITGLGSPFAQQTLTSIVLDGDPLQEGCINSGTDPTSYHVQQRTASSGYGPCGIVIRADF